MSERMSEAEICLDYRQAANPGKQIGILAELNLCGVAEIVEILERNGCKVDKRCLPRKKKQEPFRLAPDPETPEKVSAPQPAPEPEPASPVEQPEPLKADCLTVGILLQVLDEFPADTPIVACGQLLTMWAYTVTFDVHIGQRRNSLDLS